MLVYVCLDIGFSMQVTRLGSGVFFLFLLQFLVNQIVFMVCMLQVSRAHVYVCPSTRVCMFDYTYVCSSIHVCVFEYLCVRVQVCVCIQFSRELYCSYFMIVKLIVEAIEIHCKSLEISCINSCYM